MNSSRMNRLEELGRVDAEKAYTSKGKSNLGAEKSRIVRELKADGGEVEKGKSSSGPKAERRLPQDRRPSQKRQMGRGAQGSKKTNKKDLKPIIIDLDLSRPENERKIKIKKFSVKDKERVGKANGGMVTVSSRGQGKVMSDRKQKTYIC